MKIKYFQLPNCPPCQMIEDILDDINLNIETLDIRKHQQEAIKYKLNRFPALIVFEDNAEVARYTGFISEEHFRNWLNAFIKIDS